MDLHEILELPNTANSIKKIEKYLQEVTNDLPKYARAIAKLSDVTFALGNIKESFTLLFSYLPKCPNKEKTVIYDALIRHFKESNQEEEVYKMIEAKKLYLPSYNQAEYYEDLMDYYKWQDDPKEYIRANLSYLSFDLTDQKRFNALIGLKDIYMKLSEFDKAQEKNILIQTLALSLNEEEIYYQSKYDQAYFLYMQQNYLVALKEVEELLDIKTSKEIKAKSKVLKYRIFIGLGDFRKAMIFESENEEEIENSNASIRLDFYEAGLSLYRQTNNKFSINLFEKKIKELKESTEPKETEVVKKTKVKPVDLSFLEELTQEVYREIPKEVHVEKEIVIPEKKDIIKHKIKPEVVNYIAASSKLEEFSNILEKINEKDYPELREYLRRFFMSLAKISLFDECYLYTKENNHGYHYKKERLYDKKDVVIKGTIVEDILACKDEYIAPNTHEEDYIELVTNKSYKELDKQSFIAFYLSTSAVLVFSSIDEAILTAALNYETLKLASLMLETKLKYIDEGQKLSSQYQDYIFMADHLVSGFKKMQYDCVYLSEKAQEMFKCKEILSYNEFFMKINYDDVILYRRMINDLESDNISEGSIKYRVVIDDVTHYFEEHFKMSARGMILSIINEITEMVESEKKLVESTLYDPLSKLQTKSKLDQDLDLFMKDRFSMVELNVIDFKRYNEIYGNDFGDQLIYAIGKYLKEYGKYEVYHYESDKFIVCMLGEVDRRTVTHLTEDLTSYLTKKLLDLNYRLDIYFEAGIIRFPTDTKETNHKKLFEYLSSALRLAKSTDGKTSIAVYDSSFYKKTFFETQLLTHISEAIDENLLQLYYEQVIDFANQTCDHYKVKINLSNYAVKDELINEILRKRNKVSLLERYMIHRGIFEIKEIYNKVKLYFNFTFNVSYETLTEDNFAKYVYDQIDFFKINPEAVTICYNGFVDEVVLHALDECSHFGYKLASNQAEVLKRIPIKVFYYTLPLDVVKNEDIFLEFYYGFAKKKKIQFVLDGVNTKNAINHYAKYDVVYFAGKVYKAKLTMNDIISSLSEEVKNN